MSNLLRTKLQTEEGPDSSVITRYPHRPRLRVDVCFVIYLCAAGVYGDTWQSVFFSATFPKPLQDAVHEWTKDEDRGWCLVLCSRIHHAPHHSDETCVHGSLGLLDVRRGHLRHAGIS